MSKEFKTLYIVLQKDKIFHDIYIGHLPHWEVPVKSLLWKKLRSGSLCHAKDGFDGLYYDRECAEEHMKIERKWRNGCIFKIISLHDKI